MTANRSVWQYRQVRFLLLVVEVDSAAIFLPEVVLRFQVLSRYPFQQCAFWIGSAICIMLPPSRLAKIVPGENVTARNSKPSTLRMVTVSVIELPLCVMLLAAKVSGISALGCSGAFHQSKPHILCQADRLPSLFSYTSSPSFIETFQTHHQRGLLLRTMPYRFRSKQDICCHIALFSSISVWYLYWLGPFDIQQLLPWIFLFGCFNGLSFLY